MSREDALVGLSQAMNEGNQQGQPAKPRPVEQMAQQPVQVASAPVQQPAQPLAAMAQQQPAQPLAAMAQQQPVQPVAPSPQALQAQWKATVDQWEQDAINGGIMPTVDRALYGKEPGHTWMVDDFKRRGAGTGLWGQDVKSGQFVSFMK